MGTVLSADVLFLLSFLPGITVVGKAISWVTSGIWIWKFLNIPPGNSGVWKTGVIINIGWTGRGNEVTQAKLLLRKHLRAQTNENTAWRKETAKTKRIRWGLCCILFVNGQGWFFLSLLNNRSKNIKQRGKKKTFSAWDKTGSPLVPVTHLQRASCRATAEVTHLPPLSQDVYQLYISVAPSAQPYGECWARGLPLG